MNIVIGFLRFWYDFIIGDAWEIAVGVVVVLGIGATLVRTASVSLELVPLLVAAGIAVVVGVSLRMEVRRRRTTPLVRKSS
jgi:uncharacterized membrane protein